MAHITIDAVNSWLEATKLAVSSIEAELDSQIATLVTARLEGGGFDTSSWVDATSTPDLVRTVISMHYAAWVYDRAYGDETEGSAYADKLRAYADSLMTAILSGDAVLVEVVDGLPPDHGSPTFFPTDLSSLQPPTYDHPEDGPPAFMMGTVW